MSKRGNGVGSITQLAGGRYQARITLREGAEGVGGPDPGVRRGEAYGRPQRAEGPPPGC